MLQLTNNSSMWMRIYGLAFYRVINTRDTLIFEHTAWDALTEAWFSGAQYFSLSGSQGFSCISTLLSRVTHVSTKQLPFCSQKRDDHDRVMLCLSRLHLWRGRIYQAGSVLHIHVLPARYMAELVATSTNFQHGASCRQIISHWKKTLKIRTSFWSC